eukprot:324209-Amphidinium_carterae.1
MFDGTHDPEAQLAGEQERDEDSQHDPDAGMGAEVVDYRTPSVPSPSDAETLVLGAAGTTHDQEVEAHERDHRTPSVPSPIVAETDGSVVVEAIEPEAEADTHGSDMFASAVSVADSEFAVPLVADPEVPIPLPPPPPPVPD